jgi:hypothetical protein
MTANGRGNHMKALRTQTKPKPRERGEKRRRLIQLRITPAEAALNRLSRRLQEALAGRGISIEQALKNLERVRQRRFQRLYGRK